MSDVRAWQVLVTAKERAQLAEVRWPTAPLKANEVEGRTLASVVSAGTELHTYGPHGAEKRQYPAALGYGAVFEVEAVGQGVTDVKPGDLAYTSGRHCSRQRVKREDLLPVPTGLPAEKAVLTRMMGISWSTLTTTRARPPARVIVTGLGPVGHLATQIFAVCGYEVLGVEPDERRRAIARSKGIAVRAAVPLDDPAWTDRADLVVECSGHELAVRDACKVVRKRGEVVLVGVPWHRRADLQAHEILYDVFYRFVDLRSGWEWEVPGQPTDFRIGSRMENYAFGMQWIAEGRIDVADLVVLKDPHEVGQVYSDLHHRRLEDLVVVFDWTALNWLASPAWSE